MIKDYMIKKGSHVGIVCCSNGQPLTNRPHIEKLLQLLKGLGLIPICSDYIYEKENVFSGSREQRAKTLMDFYKNEKIQAIFDISGGDIANELLPYLDFEIIAKSNTMFWGYSDLTTLLNAIYTQSGVISTLYQVRHLVSTDSLSQVADFQKSIFHGSKELFEFDYQFIQGEKIEGIVVGGNIRCLLKLAGTCYWPNMKNKILLLEALGTTAAQAATYLAHLQQLGVFQEVEGILLGTFTKMETSQCLPSIVELIKQVIPPTMPLIKTKHIGHATDSKAILIGEKYVFKSKA